MQVLRGRHIYLGASLKGHWGTASSQDKALRGLPPTTRTMRAHSGAFVLAAALLVSCESAPLISWDSVFCLFTAPLPTYSDKLFNVSTAQKPMVDCQQGARERDSSY